MMVQKKDGRANNGGSGRGAGRKGTGEPRVSKTFSVSIEAWNKLKNAGVNMSSIVNNAIVEAAKNIQ